MYIDIYIYIYIWRGLRPVKGLAWRLSLHPEVQRAEPPIGNVYMSIYIYIEREREHTCICIYVIMYVLYI